MPRPVHLGENGSQLVHARAEVTDRWVNPSSGPSDAMPRPAVIYLPRSVCVCVCVLGLMAAGWFVLKSQWPVTFRSCLEWRAQACGISPPSADLGCQE